MAARIARAEHPATSTQSGRRTPRPASDARFSGSIRFTSLNASERPDEPAEAVGREEPAGHLRIAVALERQHGQRRAEHLPERVQEDDHARERPHQRIAEQERYPGQQAADSSGDAAACARDEQQHGENENANVAAST